MAKPAGTIPWALLLFWTGLILIGDAVYVVTTFRQDQATGFAVTMGKIAQSALGQGAMGRRGLRLRYTYTVDGTNYAGFRYRYDDANVSLRYGKVLDEYPAHTKQWIYYNPKNPKDSVLAPGVDGCDVLLLLVAAPFNIATYTVWSAFLSLRGRARSATGLEGLKIKREEQRLSVRLTEMPALAAGFYGLGAASAVGASAVIAIWGFEVTMRQAVVVWTATLVATAAIAVWKFVKNNSGQGDLRVDYAAKTLTLPQTAGRLRPTTVPSDTLGGVLALRRVSRTPSGRHYSYLPTLRFAGGNLEPKIAPLITWGWREDRAVAFGKWLSSELGVEFQGVENEVAAERA